MHLWFCPFNLRAASYPASVGLLVQRACTPVSPVCSSGLLSQRLQSMSRLQCVFSNSLSSTSRTVCLSSTVRALELPSLISTLMISWGREAGCDCACAAARRPNSHRKILTFLTLASFSFSRASLTFSALVWGSPWKHHMRTVTTLWRGFKHPYDVWRTVRGAPEASAVSDGGGWAASDSWPTADVGICLPAPLLVFSTGSDPRPATRASRSWSSSSLRDSERR